MVGALRQHSPSQLQLLLDMTQILYSVFIPFVALSSFVIQVVHTASGIFQGT